MHRLDPKLFQKRRYVSSGAESEEISARDTNTKLPAQILTH